MRAYLRKINAEVKNVKETDFYRSGKIDDYLKLKSDESFKERKESGTADKSEGHSDTAGQLR